MESKYNQYKAVVTSLGYEVLSFENWRAIYDETLRNSKKKRTPNPYGDYFSEF